MNAGSLVSHRPSWLIAALILVALVPAACVLWFMTAAMRNQRLAVQERLTAVHVSQLASLRQRVEASWVERLAGLQAAQGESAATTFAAIVQGGLADTAVLYDRAGKLVYPASAPEAPASESGSWAAARVLEFQKQDYAAAVDAYAQIAGQSTTANVRARALQSQAASLLKLGDQAGAIAVLERLIGDSSLRDAVSAQGTLIVPNAQLLMMKTTRSSGVGPALAAVPRSGSKQESGVPTSGSPTPTLVESTLRALVTRLNDYTDTALSAGQRRFLMEEVRALAPDVAFPTLAAEKLAVEYLERDPVLPPDSRLQQSPLPGVWQLATPDRFAVVLFRETRLRSDLAGFVASAGTQDINVKVLVPGETNGTGDPIPPQEIGDLLPGWRLAVHFNGSDPFAAAAARETRFYLWAGSLVVVSIALLAWLVARYVNAQMRLARMKNELVSTVSHELRTPLASMRALVDTLAARRFRDEKQLDEYLQLVAKENQRLSQLIENFLTFSRMERGQHPFHFESVSAATIVATALDSVRDRLTSAGCTIETQVDSGLPALRADTDALATVLINLLDNACKYSDADKRIAVHAYARGGELRFEVQDHGIGLEPKEARRIFDRFYQVDQSLTRQRGGCGLGLSIVQSIVRAHGGTVEVESQPGQGSTFRVRIPAPQTPPLRSADSRLASAPMSAD